MFTNKTNIKFTTKSIYIKTRIFVPKTIEGHTFYILIAGSHITGIEKECSQPLSQKITRI